MRKEFKQFDNSTIFEGMTSIRAILHAKEVDEHRREILEVLYDREKEKKLSKDLSYLRAMGTKYGFEVVAVDSERIHELAIGNTHGGLLAICADRPLPMLSDATAFVSCQGFYALIEGIEDPYNFGYAIRSLYACGVDGIILTERNWMSAAGVVARASAGASELLPIFISEPADALDVFHSLNYTVVAADTRTEHLLGTTEIKKPVLLLVGGEKRGISRGVLDKADLLIKIPYGRHFPASLSAASATTMFAYEIMRQNINDN